MMDNVFERILSDFRKGKLSHAIMIDGGDEAQRSAIAGDTAKLLVCSGDYSPCNKCPDCVKADAHSHPDIMTYSGGTTPSSFKVEYVRDLRQNASILPNEADRKVFILERVETMSVAAQNALLKILEEPPQFVCFVLTCSSHSSMLDTIMSRVTLYSCADSDAVQDEELWGKAHDLAMDVLRTVSNHNELQLLKLSVAFDKDKDLFKYCCKELIRIASDALIQKITDRTSSSDAEEISGILPKEILLSVISIANETIDAMQKNINGNLLATYFCAKLNSEQIGRN